MTSIGDAPGRCVRCGKNVWDCDICLRCSQEEDRQTAEEEELEDAVASVAGASSLHELVHLLRCIETLCATVNEWRPWHDRADLEDLVNVDDLPTFGPEPYDTLGVYSWDGRWLLVNNPKDSRGWRLIDREDEVAA